MSKKAAQEFISNIITQQFKSFKNAREYLNIDIHSLNVSYSVFETNNTLTNYKLSNSDLDRYYKEFIIAIKQIIGQDKVFKSLTAAAPYINRDSLVAGCILVRDTGGLFLIGANYRAIRELISLIVRQQSISASPLGVNTKIRASTGEIFFKSILELGHVGNKSPLSETINAISNSAVNDVKGNLLRAELNTALEKLAGVQAKLNYTYINSSDNVKLGSGIVNIVIQPEDVNAKFSAEESKIYSQVLTSIKKYLNILDIPGSNTLKQDAVQFVSDKILSSVLGKQIKSIKPHAKVEGKISLPKVTPKVKTTVTPYKEPKGVKTFDSGGISLTSLQNLINSQLQDVISANMGNGSSRSVLNYRTGRLAGSAKVERMSQSREGMITAFYTYMKNPYATFSDGGRQSSPKSRDPKLLISKSIREIAAEKIGNRLRAVVV